MARTSSNPRINNRSVRSKLSKRTDPYWHLIAEGQHLGYRRLDMGGTWIARFYTREHGRRFQALGAADDTATADGTHILSFSEALAAAQAWFVTVSRANLSGTRIGPYTVKDAATEWLRKWKESDGEGGERIIAGREQSYATANGTVIHHILPTLGTVEVAKLTREQLTKWLHDLASKEPVKVQQRRESAKKLSPSRQSKIVYDANDPETRRKRKDTANRVLNNLSAILNLAYANDRCSNRAVWDNIAKFENVGVPKKEYLTNDEASRFIACAPTDFRNLVYAALLTGCRYGELCNVRVNALDTRDSTISVLQSKTGKLKRIFLTEDEAAFFAKLSNGKAATDWMLERSDGEQWSKSNQQQRMKAVLKTAKIRRHVRFHDLRHTFASLLIQNGASIEVIANQLGHSGTVMATKHYAHLSPEYIGNTVRANKPSYAMA